MLLFFFNKLLRECLLNKDLSMWVIHFPYRSIIRFFIAKQTETKANKFIKSTNNLSSSTRNLFLHLCFIYTSIIMTPIHTMWATQHVYLPIIGTTEERKSFKLSGPIEISCQRFLFENQFGFMFLPYLILHRSLHYVEEI